MDNRQWRRQLKRELEDMVSARTARYVRRTNVPNIYKEEFTNPAASDDDAIKTSVASAASIQTYVTTALNGAIGQGVISPPRNIIITTSSHADIDAVAVVITGKDINGTTMIDTITLTNGGGATDVGVKCFSYVTQIVVPAQSGTGGTLKFGTGLIIGLGKKAKTTATGHLAIIREFDKDGVAVDGAFVIAATSTPNGSYAPNEAPDATKDYTIYYELDPAAW